MTRIQRVGCLFALGGLAALAAAAQTVETKDGARLVHNKKGGLWAGAPKVKLSPVRRLGDIDTDDDNYAFNMPQDLAMDPAGNLYVLDSRNGRIQKFSSDGKFLASFGRQGQGPGEFNMPAAMEIDREGRIWVSDVPGWILIFGADGKYIETLKLGGAGAAQDITAGLRGVRGFKLLESGKLLAAEESGGFRVTSSGGTSFVSTEASAEPDQKLMKILDPASGEVLRRFGEPKDDKDPMLKGLLNQVRIAVDDSDHVYAAFPHQNRIEKYSSDGRLLWRADRVLNYKLEILDRGGTRTEGDRVTVSGPRMTSCVVGLGVDGRGRVWVVTNSRQLKPEERVSMMATVSQGGTNTQVQGNRDLMTTDAYKLEVFDPDGALLGEIPLSIFVDAIFVFGDRLFLLDRMRGVCFHEFKIVEAAD